MLSCHGEQNKLKDHLVPIPAEVTIHRSHVMSSQQQRNAAINMVHITHAPIVCDNDAINW